MHLRLASTLALSAMAAAALGLAGCASGAHQSSDFGEAVRQNIAGQIADPDARYTGTPAPGANGSRVGLAQQRYVKGQVIPPVSTSTTLGVGGTPATPQ